MQDLTVKKKNKKGKIKPNRRFRLQCFQMVNHNSAPIILTSKATAVLGTTIILPSPVYSRVSDSPELL